jgi:hypothetical protein
VPLTTLHNFTGPIVSNTSAAVIPLANHVLRNSTQFYIHFGDGGASGSRNNQLFAAACDLFERGETIDTVRGIAAHSSSLPQSEQESCIQSAYNHIRRNYGV